MKKYAFFVLIFLIISTTSFGQLLPAGLIPMEHNGSFAGMGGKGRIATNMNLSFIEPIRYGHYASYDNFFKRLSTGLGVAVYNFNYAEIFDDGNFDSATGTFEDSVRIAQDYTANYIDLAIAPKLSVKGKYTISPSVKVKFGQGRKRLSRNGEEVYDRDLKSVNVTAGLVLNTTKYYFGYTLRLYSKDDANFVMRDLREDVPATPKFYSVFEAGYSFFKDEKFSFTPQLAFHIASHYKGLKLTEKGLNFRFQYSNFLFGQSVKNMTMVFSERASGSHSSVWVYGGIQKDYFRIVLMLSTEGQVDLNLRFMIPNRDKKTNSRFW